MDGKKVIIHVLGDSDALLPQLQQPCRQARCQLRQLHVTELADHRETIILVEPELAGGVPPAELRTRRNVVVLIIDTRAANPTWSKHWLAIADDVISLPLGASLLRNKLRCWRRTLVDRRRLDLMQKRLNSLTQRSRQFDARLYELQQQLQQMHTERTILDTLVSKMNQLNELSREINCLDLDRIGTVCIERIPVLTEAMFVSLYLYDPQTRRLHLQRHNHPYPINRVIAVGEAPNSLMSQAVTGKRVIHIQNIQQWQRQHGKNIDRSFSGNYRSNSCILGPLLCDQQVVGLLNVADKLTAPYFDPDIDLPVVKQVCEMLGASLGNIARYQEMKKLARTDGLTRLANYRAFYETLQKELQRAQRHEQQLSLIMIDVDSLKRVNDVHGHQVGDRLLEAIAKAITSCLRQIDTPARYGGDEFAIILPNTTLADARAVAERIVKTIAETKISFADRTLQSSVSIGVSQYDGRSSAEDFLHQADEALYAAKVNGKNRVCLFNEVGACSKG